MLLNRNQSCLLLVDVQEKLIPFIHDYENLIKNCAWILRLAQKLSVTTIVSEQYPKGLGHTISAFREVYENSPVYEKVTFSCASDPTLKQAVQQQNRSQLILIGIEAHVCVLQTAMEFSKDFDVFVVADSVSSRDPYDKKIALKRMQHSGIHIVTKEMVLFEWLHQAGNELFKEVSKEFLK